MSVDFTLHKINLFYVLNMLNNIFSGERIVILHAGTAMRDSYPTHEKIILLSYIKIIKHQYMQYNCKKKTSPN